MGCMRGVGVVRHQLVNGSLHRARAAGVKSILQVRHGRGRGSAQGEARRKGVRQTARGGIRSPEVWRPSMTARVRFGNARGDVCVGEDTRETRDETRGTGGEREGRATRVRGAMYRGVGDWIKKQWKFCFRARRLIAHTRLTLSFYLKIGEEICESTGKLGPPKQATTTQVPRESAGRRADEVTVTRTLPHASGVCSRQVLRTTCVTCPRATRPRCYFSTRARSAQPWN
mgnify:CR=1 FL=1